MPRLSVPASGAPIISQRTAQLTFAQVLLPGQGQHHCLLLRVLLAWPLLLEQPPTARPLLLGQPLPALPLLLGQLLSAQPLMLQQPHLAQPLRLGQPI